MFQNLISLEISNEQLKEVQGALAVLEKNLDGLISLSVAERHELAKMGPKSEMFARKAFDVLSLNPEIMPGTFNLREFEADIKALDQLRPVFARLAALTNRAEDTEMALGSDIYRAALDGYRFAKAAGKGTVLDEFSAHAAVRFAGQGRRKGSGDGVAK